MLGNVLGKLRSFAIRGLAVGAVVVTYAVSGLVGQVATAVGVTTVLFSSTKPAEAQWRRRRWRRRYYRTYRVYPRYYRRRYYRRRRWRR